MIRSEVLKAGLMALAEISHTTVDQFTEGLWERATRELAEEQWVHGVDVVVRTWKATWMPPPGVVIEAAYTAPPPPPTRAVPLRTGDGQWSSKEQEWRYEQAVHENPRRPTETAVQYAVRIAGLAAAMEPAPEREAGQEG